MLSNPSFRCVILQLIAGLLMSWIRATPIVSDSLIIERQFLFCQYFDIVLLLEVLLLLLEVYQFLVQRLIEQLKILETSLDIAVFLEAILSSDDVAQRILDFVVVKRLPRVELEDIQFSA